MKASELQGKDEASLKKELMEAKPHIDVLNTDKRLNSHHFPEAFRDSIEEHNDAISATNILGKDPDAIVKAFKDGNLSSERATNIVKHPKMHEIFSKDHIQDMLDHALSTEGEDEEDEDEEQ